MASYYVWSGASAGGNGTTWALAYQTLTLAFAGKAAGDIFYVAHDHAESTAASITLTNTGSTLSNGHKIICVNRAGSVPPVSADRRATAQVTTTGTGNSITFTGHAHYDGIIFSAGTGASPGASIICHTAINSWQRFDNCSMRFPITGAGSTFYANGSGGSLGGTYTELNNTTMAFNFAASTVLVSGTLVWRNTPAALIGTVPPDQLFAAVASSRGGLVECIGVDLSALGAGKTIFGSNGTSQSMTFRLIDCKLNAAVTKAVVPVAFGGSIVDIIRSGAAGVSYTVYRNHIAALLTEEIAIVRSGGASDGTTPLSWKVITSVSNISYSTPFECPPIAIWNDTVGSARTATVEGVWGGGAVPNDDEIWLDVEYLGGASSPLGSFVNDGKANLLTAAAAQAASSATWGGSTTKFKLGVTFTPQQKGWAYARVKCAKPSSTFYIDPLVTLS